MTLDPPPLYEYEYAPTATEIPPPYALAPSVLVWKNKLAVDDAVQLVNAVQLINVLLEMV